MHSLQPMSCLSVFHHFVGLAFKGLNIAELWNLKASFHFCVRTELSCNWVPLLDKVLSSRENSFKRFVLWKQKLSDLRYTKQICIDFLNGSSCFPFNNKLNFPLNMFVLLVNEFELLVSGSLIIWFGASTFSDYFKVLSPIFTGNIKRI